MLLCIKLYTYSFRWTPKTEKRSLNKISICCLYFHIKNEKKEVYEIKKKGKKRKHATMKTNPMPKKAKCNLTAYLSQFDADSWIYFILDTHLHMTFSHFLFIIIICCCCCCSSFVFHSIRRTENEIFLTLKISSQKNFDTLESRTINSNNISKF